MRYKSNSFDFSKISFNAGLLVKELNKRNIDTSYVGKTMLVKACLKDHCELLYDIYTNMISYPVGWLANDKFLTKKWLIKSEIPTVSGLVFKINDIQHALDYVKTLGYPVVIKPTNASHGDNVFTDIRNSQDLQKTIRLFAEKGIHNGFFLLEKYFTGNEYRVFFTKRGFIAVVQRTPANVVGDGKNSVLMLIQHENKRRMNPRNTCLCEIRLDEITFDYMEKNQITLDYIPGKGERVFVRGNSNVSTGGNCYDVTDNIHKSIIDLSQKILSKCGKLPYIGFDIICNDVIKSLSKQSFIICELNTAPGLSLHMLPEKGTPRNVAGALVDLLFPETI